MKQLEMLYEGKAKQVFRTDDDDVILMHYKDAATAFNNIKKATIEGKGVLNNKISTIIFGYLKEAGIPTHYISTLNERDQPCRRFFPFWSSPAQNLPHRAFCNVPSCRPF